MHTLLVPGDLVATTREIAHSPERRDPAKPDGAPIPAGTTGAVCRHVAGGCVVVDFEVFGLKAVPVSALALVGTVDGEDTGRTWTEELLDLVLQQYLEIERLNGLIADLQRSAPLRLTALPHQAISAAAAQLHAERDAWLNPPGVPERALKDRTLTNLYNALLVFRGDPPAEGKRHPKIVPAAGDFAPRLAELHATLDRAVCDAYGWEVAILDDEEEILRRLLALNLERAGVGGQ